MRMESARLRICPGEDAELRDPGPSDRAVPDFVNDRPCGSEV